MKLATITASPLVIPFKMTFKHAAAERNATQSLWVEVTSDDGVIGYGESCPRCYVTGETVNSTLAFVATYRNHWLRDIHDLDSLRAWTQAHREQIDWNPAAWAAVELAVLDLLGKLHGQSIEDLLGLRPLCGRYRYSAVIGDSPPHQFDLQLARYISSGFRDFKIKLSGEPRADLQKIDALRAGNISPTVVRADANNIWIRTEEAIAHLRALEYPFWALEEPLSPGAYCELARLAKQLNTKIILDESLLRGEQLDRLPREEDVWIANIRVSKMGGLMRSLEVISKARKLDIPVILGAHVGETSLLSRAALTLAEQARDILVGQEGAFGTHLLSRDVCDPAIMFSHGGMLDAEELRHGAQVGLGLALKRASDPHGFLNA